MPTGTEMKLSFRLQVSDLSLANIPLEMQVDSLNPENSFTLDDNYQSVQIPMEVSSSFLLLKYEFI